ncbi:MAG TPA: nitrate reductase molybdenum cofactor assembly chaperone [Aldersonia sp.]
MRLLRRGIAVDDRLVWQAASLLLDYPGDGFADRLDAVEALLRRLPSATAAPLARCAAGLRADAGQVAASRYVDTFDLRKRTTLYLTYWTSGDTRNRGREMLRFVEAYRAAAVAVPAGESPDHLAVVLEFAATVDARAGGALLAEHGVAIRMLSAALTETGSPYADVLAAVCATLPAATGHDEERARRLAREGPPAEAVGLEPFTLTVPPRRRTEVSS